MTRISIDNQPASLSHKHHKNIGEVLRAVLDSLPDNRIVTDILLDGTQLALVEDHRVLTRETDSIDQLEIKTTDKQIWASTGIDMALSRVERLNHTLIRAAQFYRDQNWIQANELFAHCLDGFKRFVEVILLTKTALKPDFKSVEFENTSLYHTEVSFHELLSSLSRLQKEKQYPEIADKIEYELLPNLAQWQKGLKILRSQSQ